jgi:uncharacterized protein YeaO (DUF488 family)
VPKARFAKDDWYDLWLPDLAPSEPLVKQALRATSEKDWRAFTRKYRKEMAAPERSRLLALLAALSQASNFSVGCYCDDAARCHRSVLRALLTERGAKLA